LKDGADFYNELRLSYLLNIIKSLTLYNIIQVQELVYPLDFMYFLIQNLSYKKDNEILLLKYPNHMLQDQAEKSYNPYSTVSIWL